VKVSSSEYLLLAAVVDVTLRTVTLPNCYFGGPRVCWFCSDCCWSLVHLSRMVFLSHFMATH